MNNGHKLSRLANRLRRIRRRLIEWRATRTAEIIRAEKSKRDPALGDIQAAIA
jgi:flagellar basal body-associated protein FliL